MLYSKRIIKNTARVMLVVMAFELLSPLAAHALTTGPSQPEVNSFEPVGTTDMVDLFTGDFVYNIPLLDVEGYPINISYHGGIDMEQEASWVGLGWNINPGVINRTVRGLPDDFKGDSIKKTLKIKPEENLKVGLNTGAELAGIGDPLINLSLNMNTTLNVSNYRGVSVDMSLGAGINVLGFASAGINLGVGSQSGADIDYNLGLNFNTSQILNIDLASIGVGFNVSHGYNTRSGLKAKSFSKSISLSVAGQLAYTGGYTRVVPIGVQNVVPVITNASKLRAYKGQIKGGGAVFGTYPYVAIYAMYSKLVYARKGDKRSYGYLYAEDADNAAIMDFTRDQDGMFNETMKYLPPGNMTYDVYSVAGQGTGGSFRPFRNDLGSVGDPFLTDESLEDSYTLEFGIGNLASIGGEHAGERSFSTSGHWAQYKRPFSQKATGSPYENVYFKQAGEATASNDAYFASVGGVNPVAGRDTKGLPAKKTGAENKRDARGNLVYYFTGDEASAYGVASSRKIYSYNSTDGFAAGPDIAMDSFARNTGKRKGYHISEMVQVQTDGSRYVYGIPAMNNEQAEYTFAVNANTSSQLVDIQGQNTENNNSGRDNFFSKTVTPAFAHSYLLTSVLSPDYVDVKGDGPTDDDFGSFTKFNYSLKNQNYHWRAPFDTDKAQYNPGFKSDTKDNKASYIEGKREQWYLHNIETRNYIAEFYTSIRKDGKGVNTTTDHSYKLDSIRLFNKHDRFINKMAAVPIKTVIFEYDYSLCRHSPNSLAEGGGKLTLKKIFVRYGNSDKGILSPYRFDYNEGNVLENPSYGSEHKDRWGAYKPDLQPLSNADFPFVNQRDPDLDTYAGAWSLKEIHLPSGGRINIEYEADDYAYVQNKEAMEMFQLEGMGKSQNFSAGNLMYLSKSSPNTYFYFKRRKDAENPSLSFRDNYLKGHDVLYCNFETRIAPLAFEPVKCYAEVLEIGYCDNNPNSDYGYVRVKPVKLTKAKDALLNPVSYTAINFGRYYLPHIVYPGNDDNLSAFANVLAGLQSSFDELVSAGKNPVETMTKKGMAKEVNLSLSYMRLTSPGLKKKGGGHRVRQLTFHDNWKSLAGGNAHDATYGKTYAYTMQAENGGSLISSGVASYEPLIGGDENPFRLPEGYTGRSGSSWPPHEPIGLFQEMPIGESLYPGAMVGYRKVTVKSIHQAEGRSAQGMDAHEFYTAKEFPIKVMSTSIDIISKYEKYKSKKQERVYRAGQGFSLVFNDMHGKLKSSKNYVLYPDSGGEELVSSQHYSYFTDGQGLSNEVPVMEYDGAAGKMKKVMKRVAMESDLTIDTREKKEITEMSTEFGNLNTFLAAFIPIPLPMIYWSNQSFENHFSSVVATKVVQQYGILREVKTNNEGAITIQRNEAFDPLTGEAVITSVNNEFQELEYSVKYPAYWGHRSMGPAYVNTGYEDVFSSMRTNERSSTATVSNVSNIHLYQPGDELHLSYTHGSGHHENIVWVQSVLGGTMTLATRALYYDGSFAPVHYFPAPNVVLTDVKVKILRSGSKNRLQESMQEYTALEEPFDGSGFLKDIVGKVVDISARTYTDTLTTLLNQTDELVNVYANGARGFPRVGKEYAYIKDREYTGAGTQQAGIFSARSLWHNKTFNLLYPVYMQAKPAEDPSWTVMREVTKWSPWGHELENRDAIGNYTSAVYGFNQVLPVALAQNAEQHEIMFESFEDFGMLQVKDNWNGRIRNVSSSSFFSSYFNQFTAVGNKYEKFDPVSSMFLVTDAAAHTGKHSLQTGGILGNFPIPVNLTVLDLYPLQQWKTFYEPPRFKFMKKYLVSYWFRPQDISGTPISYSPPLGSVLASPIIEGWQKVEYVITTTGATTFQLQLPANAFVDDIRILPLDANMKSFVYHPVTQRLVATLDENNYATLYEYDQEGNLIRTKRETEKGIMTISESRSGNVKN